MDLNVLGYLSLLLHCCHPASDHEGYSHTFPYFCERSALLIWQVHQFEPGCIKVLRRTDTKFTRNCILISQCVHSFFFLRIESTAVQRCARKSTEFASGSKIVDENRGDMEGRRSLMSQGRAERLCAIIESAKREVSEGKADL